MLYCFLECGPLAVAICTELCIIAEENKMKNSGSYSNTFTNVRDGFYACLSVRKLKILINIVMYREATKISSTSYFRIMKSCNLHRQKEIPAIGDCYLQ